MKRTTLTYAFHALWIFYFFTACICSSLGVDTKLNAVPSPPSELNETVVSSRSSPESEVQNQNTANTDGSPSTKEALEDKSDSKESRMPKSEPETKVLGSETSQLETLASNPKLQKFESDETSKRKSDLPVSDNSTIPEAAVSEGSPKQFDDSLKPATPDVLPPKTIPVKDTNDKERGPSTPQAKNYPANITVSDTSTGQKNEKETVGESATITTGTDQHEDGSDVPTFDEYQRKFTEGKQQKKHDEAAANGAAGSRGPEDAATAGASVGVSDGASNTAKAQTVKAVSGRFKNVGSTSCGAKVVAHNEEASNPAHVLNENRDEYMNHPCTAKKWFVVEACEPVRLRQIDIASYELFSSMVKTFRVSASERYPQKLWDMVGTFMAKNEKGVQTYRAEQDKYYKYFKFEILDHHGNEHFCPLSLIRLYGVLMEDDDEEDQPTDNPPESDANRGGQISAQVNNENIGNIKEDDKSRSLLESATKVIVDIVKKTLQPYANERTDSAKNSVNSKSDASKTVPSSASESDKESQNATTRVKVPESSSNMSPQEETRLSQLIKLLMSGEYSSLLRRCLELLGTAPSTVQRNLIKYEYIPSPSVAYAECSKAAASARLTPQDIRWAYLIFNNASLPWEPERRAAEFGIKAGKSQSATERETVSEISKEKEEKPIQKPSDSAEDSSRSTESVEKPPVKHETDDISPSKINEQSSKETIHNLPHPISSPPLAKDDAAEPKSTLKNIGGRAVVDAQYPPVNQDGGQTMTEKVMTKESSDSSNQAAGVTDQPSKSSSDKYSKSQEDTQQEVSNKEIDAQHQELKGQQEEQRLNAKESKPQTDDQQQDKTLREPPNQSEPEKQQQPQKMEKQEGQQQQQQSNEVHQQSQQRQDKQTTAQEPSKSEKVKDQRTEDDSENGLKAGVPQKKQESGQGKQPILKPKSVKPVSTPESGTGSNGRNVGIKENAYMRLSNKLRAMEKNVTVSMSYLEELSRSYKKKTDKMSKHMEKALKKLEETALMAEDRDKVQQKRIAALERQIEELRGELKDTVASVRKEASLMMHGVLLQALALNVLLIVIHALLSVYCSRRRRHLTVHDASTTSGHWSRIDWNERPATDNHGTQNGRLNPQISSSDTNLYIVDPPFRLEEQTVKKHSTIFLLTDGKKKKKRKKASISNQQSTLTQNGFRDRSASESRIEDLL